MSPGAANRVLRERGSVSDVPPGRHQVHRGLVRWFDEQNPGRLTSGGHVCGGRHLSRRGE